MKKCVITLKMKRVGVKLGVPNTKKKKKYLNDYYTLNESFIYILFYKSNFHFILFLFSPTTLKELEKITQLGKVRLVLFCFSLR